MKLKTKGIIHDTLTGYNFRVDAPLRRAPAIRQKCLECQGGNSAEVRRCCITDCPLWPWRMGRPLRPEERSPGQIPEKSRVAHSLDTR